MQLNNLGACDKLETDYHLLTYCVIFMLRDGPRNILVEGRRTNILMYDLIEYLFTLFGTLIQVPIYSSVIWLDTGTQWSYFEPHLCVCVCVFLVISV